MLPESRGTEEIIPDRQGKIKKIKRQEGEKGFGSSCPTGCAIIRPVVISRVEGTDDYGHD
jgi:hypothetical protein